MVQSRCGDQDVRITDKLATLAQITTNTGETFHDAPVEGEHGNHAQKLPEDPFVRQRVMAIVDAIQQFTVDDEADRNTRWSQGKKQVLGIGPAFKIACNPISVD